MGTEKMKLPDLGQVEFLSRDLVRWRWDMDPPPFVWERLPDDILISVLQTKMTHLAQLTNLEMQAKEIEGKMLTEIAEKLGGQK